VIAWIETPSNPLLKVSNVAEVSAAVKAVVVDSSTEAIVVVDSTWLTPALMRPLEWGADLTVHATTKYLGGHSDLVGGVVVGPAEDADKPEATV
jgi:cystathionine beta-lyase/cystathionine gamma-synthase